MSANVQAARAGFTLIEMLVVISMLALVATIAVPFFSSNLDRLRLRTTLNELSAALQITRSAAIRRNSEIMLAIDVDRRIFQSAVISRHSFERDIDVQLIFASEVSSARSAGGFLFFPDGSSTGGTVILSMHGQEERLCVEWFTGETRQGRAC